MGVCVALPPLTLGDRELDTVGVWLREEDVEEEEDSEGVGEEDTEALEL